jgi:ankyrin repeat protein
MTQEEEFNNIWNSNSSKEQLLLAEKYLVKFPIIDTLIGSDSFKNSLLHLACSIDNLNLVNFVFEKGANVNITYKGRNALHSTLTNGNRNNSQFQIIKILTSKGINIRQKFEDGYKQTCFLLSLQCSNLEIVKYLDVNYPESCSKSLEFICRGLHAASANQNDNSVLTYCLEIDKDVNKIDENGETPILNTYGEKARTKQLIELGANINFQDKFGTTVLHISVGSEIETSINCDRELDISNTEYLLLNGADKELTNKNGYTALDIAIKGYGGDFLTKKYSELFDKY